MRQERGKESEVPGLPGGPICGGTFRRAVRVRPGVTERERRSCTTFHQVTRRRCHSIGLYRIRASHRRPKTPRRTRIMPARAMAVPRRG